MYSHGLGHVSHKILAYSHWLGHVSHKSQVGQFRLRLASNSYVFQVEDLLLKEDVVDLLEELITNDTYPSKGGLTSAFKEAVHTCVYGWIVKAEMP